MRGYCNGSQVKDDASENQGHGNVDREGKAD